MSLVSTPEQVEFCDLLDRLEKYGVNQADVARELKMTPSQVSQIRKGKRGTSELRVDALKRFYNRLSRPMPPGMTGDESDLEVWRTRAELAERDLADIRMALLSLANPQPPTPQPRRRLSPRLKANALRAAEAAAALTEAHRPATSGSSRSRK